ncbi:MAG TPA: GIDE domain-containing protein [Terriglobales bacterium]|nr:GIDE domain-containing protein [Terriglobales bacterium]
MALYVADLLFAFNQLILLAAVGVAGGLYLFIRGFRLLARKRLLINTPTSKIRSASMGLVEVNGTASGPYTLHSPIAGIPCFLYRTTAWQKSDERRNKEWKKVAEETLHVPFFLDDGTGQLLIQPEGAELDLRRDLHQTYGDTIFSQHATGEILNFLARHGVRPDDNIRIEECCIRPQSQLFVIGTLAENPGVEVKPLARTVSDRSNGLHVSFSLGTPPVPPPEIIHLSETAPSSGEMTQQSKIAAALTKAGIANPAAWAAAGVSYPDVALASPRVTQISVNGQGHEPPEQEDSTFDLHPPVVLMKGRNDPTFLISWQSQHDLVSSLAWRSAAMIWGGAGLTLLGLYVVLAQMQLL